MIVRRFGRGTRDHQPAGFSHPPEMKRHQHDDQDREDGGVHRKKVAQGGWPDLGAAQNDLLKPAADDGDVFQHADADDGGPIGQLIPGEQISGKVGCQHEDQQTEPDNPVYLSGRVKAAGKKYPQTMQAGHNDQEIGAPEMQVADQLAEQKAFLKVRYRRIGLGGHGPVGELQQDAGEQLEAQKNGRHAAQTPGQCKSQGFFSHPAWPEM